MADKHHETQEQSIKARKHQLFDDDTSEVPISGPRKPFKTFLRETPGAPLSAGVKAGLWAAGVVVVLLLVAALLKGGRPKVGPKPSVKSTGVVAAARGAVALRQPIGREPCLLRYS